MKLDLQIDFSDTVNSEEVQLLWSMLSAEFEEESGDVLLENDIQPVTQA